METLIQSIEKLLNQNIFLAFLLAYLGGIMTTFTPCIYPMIPVTLAITLGTDNTIEKKKRLIGPFFYCLGIALAYSLLGVFAAATGTFFGSLAANPWLFVFLAGVFMLMTLNLLGIISLPALQINYKANRTSKLSLLVLGMVTGTAFSPCTAPMMGIFLVYAATQNLFFGGLLLFCFAAGFSSLLLLMAWASLSAKSRLPKAGRWLEWIKKALAALCFSLIGYFVYKAYILFTGRIL